MDPNNNLTGNNPADNTTPGVTPDPALGATPIPAPDTPSPAPNTINPAAAATPVAPGSTPINAPEAPQQPLSGPIDLSAIESQFGTETAPEAPEEPVAAPETPPEPIIPTSPLPGSIGSVASGEPLPVDGSAPVAPTVPISPTPVEPVSAPATPTPIPQISEPAPQIPEAPSFAPADQVAQSPLSQPQPLDQGMQTPLDQPRPVMEQPPSVSTAPLGPAPTQDKPKSKIIIILLIVLAVLILGLGAFAAVQILGNNNNQSGNAATPTSTGQSGGDTTPAPVDPEKTILACALDGDAETVASMGENVTAFNQQYTVNYVDDELADISTVSTITFNDAENATNSIASLEESYKTYYTNELKLATDPFKSTFITDKDEPTKLIVTHFAASDALTANTSKFFNINSATTDGGYLTDQTAIKELYEDMGLTCTSRDAVSGAVTIDN